MITGYFVKIASPEGGNLSPRGRTWLSFDTLGVLRWIVAVTTVEYNNAAACEAAKAADVDALASAFRQPRIVATCTPKG
jgi:hypothetical protein